MPTGSQSYDCSLSRHSPYTSKSTSCRLRASSTRLDVDLSVHGLKASRKVLVDGAVLLCYGISKVAKGLFFLREKSGCMTCRRQDVSDCEATAPGPRRHGGSRRNQTNSAYCWRFGMRTRITLSCTECKQRNYNTTKDKKTHPERLEMKKYCRFCRKHTVHKETK